MSTAKEDNRSGVPEPQKESSGTNKTSDLMSVTVTKTCAYKRGRCENICATKKNGEPHSLCEEQ